MQLLLSLQKIRGKYGDRAKTSAASICPTHFYGKQLCTMGAPSTVAGWLLLSEQDCSKAVSDVKATKSSAAEMWMTQMNGPGIAWAGEGRKPDRI